METTRTKGHEFTYSLDGVEVEVYRDARGEWYSGPTSNTIDVGTGYRLGRWLGPAWWRRGDAVHYLGLDREPMDLDYGLGSCGQCGAFLVEMVANGEPTGRTCCALCHEEVRTMGFVEKQEG